MDFSKDILFELMTPLGFTVRTTKSYWELITTIKHPVLRERIEEVKATLINPDFIRQSKNDTKVIMFYKQYSGERWLCAVIKRQDNNGFIITAYPTDSVKEGIQIWTK